MDPFHEVLFWLICGNDLNCPCGLTTHGLTQVPKYEIKLGSKLVWWTWLLVKDQTNIIENNRYKINLQKRE